MDLSCLNPMPAAGTGLHLWIAQSAAKLVARGHDEAQIEQVLIGLVIDQRGAHEARREVRAAVESAIRKFPHEPSWKAKNGSMLAPIPTQPIPIQRSLSQIPVNWDRVRAITLSKGSSDWLNFSAPTSPKSWLQGLFGPKELVCASTSGPQQAKTLPRDEWMKEVQQIELVVPSPMSAAGGVTQDGKPSVRCIDNTGTRRWLVIEFDFQADKKGMPSTDCGRFVADLEKAGVDLREASGRLFNHLRTIAPLGLVVWSGNKSLHGWFNFEGHEAEAGVFMRFARTLGADPATWVRCQMVRFPDGIRHDRKQRQAVGFHDPKLFPALK